VAAYKAAASSTPHHPHYPSASPLTISDCFSTVFGRYWSLVLFACILEEAHSKALLRGLRDQCPCGKRERRSFLPSYIRSCAWFYFLLRIFIYGASRRSLARELFPRPGLDLPLAPTRPPDFPKPTPPLPPQLVPPSTPSKPQV